MVSKIKHAYIKHISQVRNQEHDAMQTARYGGKISLVAAKVIISEHGSTCDIPYKVR